MKTKTVRIEFTVDGVIASLEDHDLIAWLKSCLDTDDARLLPAGGGDGRSVATARDAWFDSVEGAQCASAFTLPAGYDADKYLRNRLERAFIAGANSVIAQPPVEKREAVPLDFIAALKIAESVFDQYKVDQPKWWRKLDGTPMINDLAVRMAQAFIAAQAKGEGDE